MKKRLLLPLVSLAMMGCQQGPTPASVTADFWSAVVDNDQSRMRSLALDPNVNLSELGNSRHYLASVTVGNTIMLGDLRKVEIALASDVDHAGEARTLPIQTRVLKKDGSWKVDVEATLDHLRAAVAHERIMQRVAQIEPLKQGLQFSLDGGVDAFLKQLNKKMPSLHEELKGLEDRRLAEQLEAEIGRNFAAGLVRIEHHLQDDLEALAVNMLAQVERVAQVGEEDQKVVASVHH